MSSITPVTSSIPRGPNSRDYKISNITSFGGINSSENPFDIAYGEAYDMKNVYVNDEGTLVTRPRLDYTSTNSTFTTVLYDDGTLKFGKNANNAYICYEGTTQCILPTGTITDWQIFKNSEGTYLLTCNLGYYYLKNNNHTFTNIKNSPKAYIPTLYKGKSFTDENQYIEYEQKNLLSNKYKEEYLFNLQTDYIPIKFSIEDIDCSEIFKRTYKSWEYFTTKEEDSQSGRSTKEGLSPSHKYAIKVVGKDRNYHRIAVADFELQKEWELGSAEVDVIYAKINFSGIQKIFIGKRNNLYLIYFVGSGGHLVKFSMNDYGAISYIADIENVPQTRINIMPTTDLLDKIYVVTEVENGGHYQYLICTLYTDTYFGTTLETKYIPYNCSDVGTMTIYVDYNSNEDSFLVRTNWGFYYLKGDSEVLEETHNIKVTGTLLAVEDDTITPNQSYIKILNLNQGFVVVDTRVEHKKIYKINPNSMTTTTLAIFNSSAGSYSDHKWTMNLNNLQNESGQYSGDVILQNPIKDDGFIELFYDDYTASVYYNGSAFNSDSMSCNVGNIYTSEELTDYWPIISSSGSKIFINFDECIDVLENNTLNSKVYVTYTEISDYGHKYTKVKSFDDKFWFYNSSTNPNKTVYTKDSTGYYIPEFSYVDVGDKEPITDLLQLTDSYLGIFKKDKAYTVTEDEETSDLYYIQNLKTELGNKPIAQSIVASYSNNPIVINDYGIYGMVQTKNVVETDNVFYPLTDDISSRYINIKDKQNIKTHNHRFYTYFYYYENDVTKIYVLDNRNSAWYYWELPIKIDYMFEDVLSTTNSDEIQTNIWSGNKLYKLTTKSYGEIGNNNDTDNAREDIAGYQDVIGNKSYQRIDWFWETAPMPISSINYIKKLLDMSMVFADRERELTYDKNANRYIYTKSGFDDKNLEVFYDIKTFRKKSNLLNSQASGLIDCVSNVRLKPRIQKFDFLTLKLYNHKLDDDGNDFWTYNDDINALDKLNLIGITFKTVLATT